MNTGNISGIVYKVTDDAQRKDWQYLVVRYGAQRAMSGHQVEFINAALLEVPAYITTNPLNQALLQPGTLVNIRLRPAGRARTVAGTRFVDNMPVVEAIERAVDFRPSFIERAMLPPINTLEGASVALASEGLDPEKPDLAVKNLLNIVMLSGYLLRAIPSGKRDSEGNKRISSATLHIQTARNKDDSGTRVNEAMVRLSEFLYPKVFRILQPGRRFDMICRYQGVMKTDKDIQYIDNELVADKISLTWGEKATMMSEAGERRPASGASAASASEPGSKPRPHFVKAKPKAERVPEVAAAPVAPAPQVEKPPVTMVEKTPATPVENIPATPVEKPPFPSLSLTDISNP